MEKKRVWHLTEEDRELAKARLEKPSGRAVAMGKLLRMPVPAPGPEDEPDAIYDQMTDTEIVMAELWAIYTTLKAAGLIDTDDYRSVLFDYSKKILAQRQGSDDGEGRAEKR